MIEEKDNGLENINKISFIKLTDALSFPEWTSRMEVVRFFRETMKPYEDKIKDILSRNILKKQKVVMMMKRFQKHLGNL